MPNQKPKPRKAGRPPLPKGDAKGVMLRVRITPEDRKIIEAKARTGNQSVSQWIRSTLAAAVES
jgi:predicted HicB family RNase H-like nuclease